MMSRLWNNLCKSPEASLKCQHVKMTEIWYNWSRVEPGKEWAWGDRWQTIMRGLVEILHWSETEESTKQTNWAEED